MTRRRHDHARRARQLPKELARRLELAATMPAELAVGWAPTAAASPDVRAELHEALLARVAGAACTPILYLEVLGARARRMIADDLLLVLHDGPNRYALEDVDRRLAARGGRLIIAAVGVNT